MAGLPDPDALLSVRDLVVEFSSPDGPLRAVDGVSFDLYPDQVLGVVGESGSGKSVTMLTVMGLLPPGRARVAAGEVWYRGQDLLRMPLPRLRALRGGELAMIFQDPTTSLNPVRRVGVQLAEAIALHQPRLSRAQVRARVVELLGVVGVPAPERRYRQYPHEFSGGMRQRAMIAMAIANEPTVLIADEPTTALDVTIQAQVLEVLAEVRGRSGASMIMISHDLGLVAETADQVTVMYGGKVMESSGVVDMFTAPRHPYTVGLLASLPRLDSSAESLFSIPGSPPGLRSRPHGCPFHPRCGMRRGRAECEQAVPALAPAGSERDHPQPPAGASEAAGGRQLRVAPATDTTEGHLAACHFSSETEQWRTQTTAVAAGDSR